MKKLFSIIIWFIFLVNNVFAASIISNQTSYYETLMKMMFDENTPVNYAKNFYESHNFLKELYRDNTPSNFTINLSRTDFENWFSNISINWTHVPFIDNSWIYISAKAKWSWTAWTEVFLDDIDSSVYWRKITTPVSDFMTNANIEAIPLFTKIQSNWSTLASWQKIYAFILLPSWNLIIPDTAYPVRYRKKIDKGSYTLSKSCVKPWDSLKIISYCQKNPVSYYFTKNEDPNVSITGDTIYTTSNAKWVYYLKWAGWVCNGSTMPEISFTVNASACETPKVPFTTYVPSTWLGWWYSWGGWYWSWWWGGGWWSYSPPQRVWEIWFPTISLRIKLWAFEDTDLSVSDEWTIERKYEGYLLQKKYKTTNGYKKLFVCYMKKTDYENIYCWSLDFQANPVKIKEVAIPWSVSQFMNIRMAETESWDGYFTLAWKRYSINQDAATIDEIITLKNETQLSLTLGSFATTLINWFDKKITWTPVWLDLINLVTTAKEGLSSNWLTKLSVFENNNAVQFEDKDEFYEVSWTNLKISCKKHDTLNKSICAIVWTATNQVEKRETTKSYNQPVLIPVNDKSVDEEGKPVTKMFIFDAFDDLSNITQN